MTISNDDAGAQPRLPTPVDFEARVRDFLAQGRIAVVGVSRTPQRHPAANAIYRRLKATGAQVFAVNPALETFEGDACFASVRAIPGGVDGAVVVTRPEITEEVARDCVEAAVPRLWMHASGARGSSVSPAAVALCEANGVTVIAGACPMMFGPGVDFGHRCMRMALRLSGAMRA